MKKKTFKRLAWAAGLTFALLPLTVIPGLSYEVEGPAGMRIMKTSLGFDNHFAIRLPSHSVGYMLVFENDFLLVMVPEGFTSWAGSVTFRFRGFAVWVEKR